MHILTVGLAADTGRAWIYLAIAALACVLAAEAVCIVLIAMRMRAARKIRKAEEERERGTSLSGFGALALAGGVVWASEVWLVALGALALAGAAAVGVLLIVCRVKGYLFVSVDEMKKDEAESREKTEPTDVEEADEIAELDEISDADRQDDADRAIAAFAETAEPDGTPEAGESENAEPEDEPEQAAPVPTTRMVETTVTETVRETVRERQKEAAPAEEPTPAEEENEDALDNEPDDSLDSIDDDSDDGDEDNELNDPDHFTGNERIIGFDDASGCYIVARYRKSFEAKLIQSQSHIKKYYSEIKNALLAYKGTKSRMSWTADSFHNGRAQIAKINVKTRILELYLALDPATLDGSVYRGQDVGALKKYEETPFRYKIRTPRKFRWALELVARVCEEHGLAPIDIEHVDYEKQYPFDTIDHLVERKLIKVTTRLEKPATTFEFDNDRMPEPEPADAGNAEAIPAAAASWEYDGGEAPAAAEQLAAEVETPAPAETTDAAVETETVRETVRITQIRYTERYGENGEPISSTNRVIADAPVEAVLEESAEEDGSGTAEPEAVSAMNTAEDDPLTAAFGEAHPENLWSEETSESEAERMNEGTDDADVSDFAEEPEEEPVEAFPADDEYTEESLSVGEEGDENALAAIFSDGNEIPVELHDPNDYEPDFGEADGASEDEESLTDREPAYTDHLYEEVQIGDLPAEEPEEPQKEPEPQPFRPQYGEQLSYETQRRYEAAEEPSQPRGGQYEPSQTYGPQASYGSRDPYGSQTAYTPREPERPTYAPAPEPRYETPAAPPREEPKKKQVDPELAVIDVSLLDINFADGDHVNLAVLQRRGLALSTATKLKVRARGAESMRHALVILANQFTYDAIRVISEAGGEAQFIR